MISLHGLIEAWGRALASDADLSAWATAAYGRDVDVRTYVDHRKRPELSSCCPLAVLVPVSCQVGRDQAERSYDVELHLMVHDATEHVQRLSDEFLPLALDAMEGATGSVSLGSVQADFDFSDFPYVGLSARITVTVPRRDRRGNRTVGG